MSDQAGTTITVGSGNVFADLGFEEPERELVRARLASAIDETMRVRGLTQTAAAKLAGVPQPHLSNIVRGRIGNVTIDYLTRILNALDQDVRIVVGPKRGEAAHTVVEREPVRAFAAD